MLVIKCKQNDEISLVFVSKSYPITSYNKYWIFKLLSRKYKIIFVLLHGVGLRH